MIPSAFLVAIEWEFSCAALSALTHSVLFLDLPAVLTAAFPFSVPTVAPFKCVKSRILFPCIYGFDKFGHS